jgi:hypothetical protein
MGIGGYILQFYATLKEAGIFDDVERIMELGSQDIQCPDSTASVEFLLSYFEKPVSDSGTLKRFSVGPARQLFEHLGYEYACVDTDGRHGAVVLDLNFDSVTPDHLGRYDLVTNHGTTEHVLNQANAFKVMHDFTRPGGYMMHVLPFMNFVDHGYFSYQPVFFEELALVNEYTIHGIWILLPAGHHIPWKRGIEKFFQFGEGMSGVMVLYQKTSGAEFSVPFQGVYTNTRAAEVAKRYSYVIDGRSVNAAVGAQSFRQNAVSRVGDGKDPGSWRGTGGNPQLALFSFRELLSEARFRVRRRLRGA